MSVYGRLSLLSEQASVSDYSDARLISGLVEMTQDEELSWLIDITNSIHTLDLAEYTTIEYVVILNYSTSLTVTATCTGSIASGFVLPAADSATKPSFAVFPNVSPSADLGLVASGAGPASVRVIVFGT